MASSTLSSKQSSNTSHPDNFSIWVLTDRKEYPLGQPAIITVKINDSTSPNFTRKVTLEVRPVNSDIVEYRSALLIDARGASFGFSTSDPGTFNATVFTIVDGSMESATTTFKFVELYHTQTANMIYLSIGFLAALLLLITIGIMNVAIDEILRFIFISGIVGSILVGFLVTDKQFGIRSPIGIVVKSTNNSNEWVLNIGGGPPIFNGTSYVTGLQIPIYVLVIGLVGGYLRYLYKTSKLMTDNELIKERQKIKMLLTKEHTRNIARRISFYQSLKDLVLLFLSPLMAVAVWFLISQWRPTENSVQLIGLVCLSASLLTVEIVNTIIRFTKDYLKKPESAPESSPANNIAKDDIAPDVDPEEDTDVDPEEEEHEQKEG
jgi:diacylglycerol kinase